MAISNTPRVNMAAQDPHKRIHNFNEVNCGLTLEQAMAEAERCLDCKNPRCVKGCPVNIDIPRFINYIKTGELDNAYKAITETNNLPAVCGRVCPQEEQCEKLCIRGPKLGGAVAIGHLERFVADHALNVKDVEVEESKCIARNNIKVAVVGSGPAGLTCAADCAAAGMNVTIFEAFHEPGGVLVYGIPEFRLPKAIVAQEIEKLKKLGVTIQLNTIIGKTLTIEELQEEYDAIFLGSGAGLPQFLNIPGESLNGVSSANEYLTRINLMKAYKSDSATPVYTGKNVVVVGAGNVAMDAARTALRMGANKVTVVYRRSREEMPARAEEIVHAEHEGIEFKLLTSPLAILGDKKVEGIRCQAMKLGEPDQSGRRRPVPIEGEVFDIESDQVIMAIGTSPNPLIKNSCPELEVSKWGTMVVNEHTYETSISNIYAGGDAVTGAATVILAMGAGKIAAQSIKDRLMRECNK